MSSALGRTYRILDLTRSIAGPWTTRMLADAGFEVVKLEPAPAGDFIRHLPAVLSEYDSGYFRQANAGKRSICVDLKNPAGREILWRLVPEFDVIIHNMRPNAAERLGITEESVRAANPEAIFARISGYGGEDAFVRRPGQDMAVQCLSGIVELTGRQEGAPSVPIWSLVDTLTSAYAYLAICSALLAREKGSITGASIEIVMSECSALLHDVAPFLHEAGSTFKIQRSGRYHPYFAVRGIVPCVDGLVAISAFRARDWRRLALLLGQDFRPDLSVEERFQQKTHIEKAVDRYFADHTVMHALQVLGSSSIPAYAVPESLTDVDSSGLFQERGMLVRTPDGGLFVAGMMHRTQSAEHILNGSPALGAANYDVLTQLARLTSADVMNLVTSGTIGCEPSVLEELVALCLEEDSVVA